MHLTAEFHGGAVDQHMKMQLLILGLERKLKVHIYGGDAVQLENSACLLAHLGPSRAARSVLQEDCLALWGREPAQLQPAQSWECLLDEPVQRGAT